MDDAALVRQISHVVTSLKVKWPYAHESGKVRENFGLPDGRRIVVTTDRLSAFDRVVTAVPYKGQVLNQLSAFWFRCLDDIIPNHLLDVPDPNVSVVRECVPLPVEVIVRGYITGVTSTSLWTLYAQGNRVIYGHTLAEGLQKDDKLPEPLITPTTKAQRGQHDESLTCAEVVERGLVDKKIWDRVQDAALAVFHRGQQVAEEAGFLLVDTKYEFGVAADGTLMLIDEAHTPDSSRFWTVDSYDEMRRRGGPPSNWDKEFVRLWYVGQQYRGEGPVPPLPDDVIVQAAARYIGLYQGLTGAVFEPGPAPATKRIEKVVRSYLE